MKKPRKSYMAEWRHNNRDKMNASQLKYYEANKELVDLRMARERFEVKRQTIEAYGGKCKCCGEELLEFLTMDHIRGGGNKHRREVKKTGMSFYRFLRKEGYPKKDYRVLCFNCNCSIGLFGYCPHEILRKQFKCEELEAKKTVADTIDSAVKVARQEARRR